MSSTPTPPEPHDGRIDRAFAALARTMVRYRYVVVVFWLALVVVIPKALPSLSSATKGQNADFLPKDSPSSKAADLGAPFQAKNALSTLLVAARSDGSLTASDDQAVNRLRATLGHDRQVLDVRDQGTSADGRAHRLLIELRSTVGFGTAHPVFDRMRADIRRATAPPGLQVHLAGELAAAVDEDTQDKKNNKSTQLFSVLFIILLLLVVFRAALAPLITLMPAALSLIIAGPLIGEAARAGVQVDSLTQILLTVIVLGAGTDYGLFLIYRVREEIANGRDPRDAVTLALSRVGETISFSAACVIFALLSLLFADFGLYRGLGPGLAIGVACVLLAGLSLMPALLAIAGRAAFWPTRPAAGQEHGGLWGRVAARVVGTPKRTLIIGLIVFGGLALGMLGYTPAGFGTSTAPSGSDSAQGQKILDAHFPPAVRNPTNVIFRLPRSAWTDPTPVVAAQQALSAARPFTSVLGGLAPQGTPLPQRLLTTLYAKLGPPQGVAPDARAPAGVPAGAFAAYRAAGQFISRDGRTIQYYVALRAGDPAGTPAEHATPAIRAAVTAVARRIGATDSGVAGQATATYDVSKISTRDLQRIVPIVLVIIALLLAILLRSLIAPLYLIASVVLSYLASLGFAILIFVEIGNEPGLNFVLPFFMFVFLMALGSDYNILVMTRIREEARQRPLREAVRIAIGATGGTVTSAGLVLAGTFAVLTITGNSQTREIGLGLAAGVLLDTFLVRTLLIPSLVVLIGRRNWWPSPMGRADAPAPGEPGE
jgi:RND superfamily putative drug exporter